ncbi:hypothetical protein [Reyranella sp.]|uniref:hypothetical protein n=1 Tax=Reyranella sp. TaxID=1929291 RepID=UPI003BAB0291
MADTTSTGDVSPRRYDDVISNAEIQAKGQSVMRFLEVPEIGKRRETNIIGTG